MRKIRRAACLILALVAFAAFAFTGCSVKTPDKVTAATESGVFVVQHYNSAGENVSGTCFAVESFYGGVYAMTNYHVVMDAPEGLTVTVGGERAAAELVGYYEYHDIAVIRIYTDDEVECLSVDSFVPAAEGDGAWSVGNEHGYGRIIVDDGKTVDEELVVEADRLGRYGEYDVDGKYIPVVEYSCSIESGMSGCPVFDEDGCVTGVGAYRTERSSHYYGVDARLARAVYRAAREGDFIPAVGAGAESGLETDVTGGGEYRIFISRDAANRNELVVFGRYSDWGESRDGGTFRRLHGMGFTALSVSEGLRVATVGDDCPLAAGDFITAIGGVSVVGATFADVMSLLYDGYELMDAPTGSAAVVTLADGREVTLSSDAGAIALRG